MNRDFRPEELDVLHSKREVHRLEITHKASGVTVKGTGPNRYQLECELLEHLRKKLREHENRNTGDIPCLQ